MEFAHGSRCPRRERLLFHRIGVYISMTRYEDGTLLHKATRNVLLLQRADNNLVGLCEVPVARIVEENNVQSFVEFLETCRWLSNS